MAKDPKLADPKKLEKKLNKQMAKVNKTRNQLEKARAHSSANRSLSNATPS